MALRLVAGVCAHPAASTIVSARPIRRTPQAYSQLQMATASMTLPARARMFVILGGLTAFGPLSIDMYLPALPAIGRS